MSQQKKPNKLAGHTKDLLKEIAQKYANDVSALFVITEDGSLLSTRPALEKIQEWYNDTYMLISLITATPLAPVEFDFTGSEDNAASANRQKLTNVFAMVYLGLLHFAQTFGVNISERLRQCAA